MVFHPFFLWWETVEGVYDYDVYNSLEVACCCNFMIVCLKQDIVDTHDINFEMMDNTEHNTAFW